MELVIQDRGTGKTTGVIVASHQFGYPIVTLNSCMVNEIIRKAKEMNLNIPTPITVNELRRGVKRDNRLYDKVLIDEVYPILEQALNHYLGCEVIAATMTDVYSERNRMKWTGL